jgi:glycogen synthase
VVRLPSLVRHLQKVTMTAAFSWQNAFEQPQTS